MPAIITHEFFGRKLLDEFEPVISFGQDVRNAFLLGNQGPDPLFYLGVNPLMAQYSDLGSRMHAEDPSNLIFAWTEIAQECSPHERYIVRAYAAGFVCHYLLDSATHPLVFSQEYAFCDAGIEGLTRKDGSEVHALIESDLDEMVLYSRTGMTIADFAPQKEILLASPEVLRIVSVAFAEAVDRVYAIEVPETLFATAVKHFRAVRGILHSPTGLKRQALGMAEQAIRPHSFARAMMPRPVANEDCVFANLDCQPWVCPFTGDQRRESFEELFQLAHDQAVAWLPMLFGEDHASMEDVRQMTGGRNFSGDAKTIASELAEHVE